MADLHFTVQNGAGTTESPMAGELDHLPDSNQHAAGGSSTIEFIQSKLAQSAHPSVIIFHLLFKGIAVFIYMFSNFIINKDADGSRISLTVFIILLLAADFWVVKNVTGRFLVGLRWWNRVDNDSTTWIFESAENQPINNFDRNMFWSILYLTPIVWAGMMIFAFIRFDMLYFMLCGTALALAGANVYGYYKCSSEQKEKFESMVQVGAARGAMAMMPSVLSVLSGNTGPPRR